MGQWDEKQTENLYISTKFQNPPRVSGEQRVVEGLHRL